MNKSPAADPVSPLALNGIERRKFRIFGKCGQLRMSRNCQKLLRIRVGIHINFCRGIAVAPYARGVA
jgi:hypothetical protein